MFRRVLVANRGEIAYRVIKTLKAMGIESAVVFSEADRHAAYVHEADHAICIGAAPAQESYLFQDAILEAALLTECEAIHPGFGFLSENACFATRCLQQKLTFIGPSPHHISLMGDKAKAIETMRTLNVPTLFGSQGIIKSFDELKRDAEKIGYPILLKARAGGGGKGMRLVEHEQDLTMHFDAARMEAQSAFGDQELYLEKFVKNARHIEFQILGDNYGNVIVLGERECSIQRKNQKLLEEAPAHNFPAELRHKMTIVLSQAMKKIGYSNAGTLEFLLDDTGHLYFMEMNTRIQVEHPVTELVYGVDLIEWQVRIAAGEKLTLRQEDMNPHGAAIECRINAEDPKHNFKPNPGLVTTFLVPKNHLKGPVRIDTYLTEGTRIAPFYDSMVAKVIVHDKDRFLAIQRMKKTLDDMQIGGVTTTIDVHKSILNNKDFVDGHYTCSFIPTYFADLLQAS